MNLLAKITLPLVVVGGAIITAQIIKSKKPEPRTRPQTQSMVAVDATRLKPTDYPVVIPSRGTVQPTVANVLVPEVAGTVNQLSPRFVVGGEFTAGEVLVEIDKRDYQIAVRQAQANFAQAAAQLQEEQALGERARAEWRSLGRGGDPSDLTLRLPQLAAAEASLDAAKASVQRAELDLERSDIVAPYAGRVLEKTVELGQYVNRGATIGRIHASASMDVRLPLTNRQLTYLDLPTGTDSVFSDKPAVQLHSEIGGLDHRWSGKVIRSAGVDEGTQQLNVIVRVEQPVSDQGAMLRAGQFVTASISGRVLSSVFVIPRSALREEQEVLVYEDSTIVRRKVRVLWSDADNVAVDEGLEPGSVLITTALSTVVDGTPARATIDGVPPEPLEPRGPRGKRGEGGKPGGDGKRPLGNQAQSPSGAPSGETAGAGNDRPARPVEDGDS